MSDTQNFAIWHPEYDGHAPPNWREGMVWCRAECGDFGPQWAAPCWFEGDEYHVPSAAIALIRERVVLKEGV